MFQPATWSYSGRLDNIKHKNQNCNCAVSYRVRLRSQSVVFQYISNKMQLYTVYLYLETALHVSSVTSTYHQEDILLYLQHPEFVTPLLLPRGRVGTGLSVLWVAFIYI
jgi:hypothetical protein